MIFFFLSILSIYIPEGSWQKAIQWHTITIGKFHKSPFSSCILSPIFGCFCLARSFIWGKWRIIWHAVKVFNNFFCACIPPFPHSQNRQIPQIFKEKKKCLGFKKKLFQAPSGLRLTENKYTRRNTKKAQWLARICVGIICSALRLTIGSQSNTGDI